MYQVQLMASQYLNSIFQENRKRLQLIIYNNIIAHYTSIYYRSIVYA